MAESTINGFDEKFNFDDSDEILLQEQNDGTTYKISGENLKESLLEDFNSGASTVYSHRFQQKQYHNIN